MVLTALIFKCILILVIFTITLTIAAYSTYGERKVAAFMQDRLGPNRTGPFGILQPLADAGKMFFKEEFFPAQATSFLFLLGPSLAMLTALMTGVVIPWGDTLELNGVFYELQITDLNIGILYIFGVVSIGVYGIMMAVGRQTTNFHCWALSEHHRK